MAQLERSLKSTSLSETLKTYDEWAKNYNKDVEKEEYVAPQIAAEHLVKCLGSENIEKAKILDAGCGTGLVGEALTKLGAKNLDGIDLSPGMLEVAQRTGMYQSLNVANLAERLDIPSQTYDAVICVGTMTEGHVGPEAFDEFVRVTKAGGFIVSTIRESVWKVKGYEDTVDAFVDAGKVKLVASILFSLSYTYFIMDAATVGKAFQSERLTYRSVENNDHDKNFLFDLENDPLNKVLSDQSFLRPKSKKAIDELMIEFQKAVLPVIICLSPNEAKNYNSEPGTESKEIPIGFIVLGWGGKSSNREHHRNIQIGIALAESYRNKGYGGEAINWGLDWAFRFGGFHRVSIGTVSFNDRAQHLYKKLGFIEEGRSREAIWFDRKWHDMIEYGMLECNLCGLRILEPIEDEDIFWLRQFFTVDREPGKSTLSFIAINSHEDASLEPSDDFQGVLFHQSCWPILLDQLFLMSGRRYEKEEILRVLFDLTKCLPSGRWPSYLCHENEKAVWNLPGSFPRGWEFLEADPSILRIDQSPISLPNEAGIDLRPENSLDCFSGLSTELVHHLATFLDTSSLCQLRLSSRIIASLTKPKDLPQAFWASRFSGIHERGFFPVEYDTDSIQDDWRTLYFNLQHTLHDNSKQGHMNQRERIWKCIGRLTPSMICMLQQQPTLRDTAELEMELVSRRLTVTQRIQGLKNWPCRRISEGIPVTGSQYLSLKPQEADTLRISISRVRLYKKDYICGFRTFRQCQTSPEDEASRVGWIQPASEVHITITSSDQITTVRVAVTFGGILGLGLQTRDVNGQIFWRSVGELDKLADHVGVTTLEPQNGSQVSGLLFGIDPCKVVSVQLVEQTPAPATTAETPSTKQNIKPAVWHPVEPAAGLVTIPPVTAIDESPNPAYILNMDFGGTDGSLLPLLSRIVVFHDEKYDALKGLGFSYTDGNYREYGVTEHISSSRERWGAVEQSLSIDGPGGERIIGVGFYMLNPHEGHYQVYSISLVITTNWGRSLRATNMGRQIHDPIEKADERTSCSSPNGEPIIGILAAVHMRNWESELASLGLVHLNEPATNPSPSKLQIDWDEVETRSKTDPEDEKSHYRWPGASVRFDDTKRVGISSGKPWRTRGPSHVSGLCFEFWDGRPTMYVGQWFQEVAHLDLDRGERITKIVFWGEVRDNWPEEASTEQTGMIGGVRIEKSGIEPNYVEFNPSGKRDTAPSRFVESHFERLDGIAWGLSYRFDQIDVITRPADPRQGRLSCDPVAEERLMSPSDKLFWRTRDQHGAWHNVTRIDAFFRDDSDRPRLCGLQFTYGNDQLSASSGATKGAKASFVLKPGEEITRACFCKKIRGENRVRFCLGDTEEVILSSDGTVTRRKQEDDTESETCRNCGRSMADCQARKRTGEDLRKSVGIWSVMQASSANRERLLVVACANATGLPINLRAPTIVNSTLFVLKAHKALILNTSDGDYVEITSEVSDGDAASMALTSMHYIFCESERT
ncbi:hypothetical protein F53441_9664 [Fusarium austroafricanum]|uniref:N-acetyltransferase domain-containing protein n=1 Tax=Fusarium austroafricanum TaxID=2364996 RepID=A0A8H4NT34_9HYPO|nr:hypothetical protein F53441_9664 [Fusarium austroafricanum]